MFLSTEKPSNNPSSSSNFLHLTSSSDELDPLNLPSFSIRDYAFSYRTKNIKNNWPFSSKSLQLCLKHGLLHPLPSFQPFDDVITTLHSMEALSLKKQIIPQINQTLAETQKGFENGFLLPVTSRLRSKVQVSISSKNPRKKCRITAKPGACVNSESKEDSCVAVSESMALRTCPICKTFSSASNTTLNVHIDQCLSLDSRQQLSKPIRLRVKPLKVKLMTDIYASARGCTLEDLDKRNGTKWATVSSYSNQVVADKSEASNKEKNRTLLSAGMDEYAPGIGPVYIDGKGQKLRILSEFREKASTQVREDKGNKSFKKKLGGKKHYKYHKLYSQSRRLDVHKSDVSKIPEYQRRYNEEGRVMEKSETLCPEQSKTFDVSENEDEDTGKWESEMTQEHQLIDDDDGDEWNYNGESYEDVDNERCKETVIKGNDVLDNTKDKDAEFESMIYEKLGCNSAEQGSSLMEFDPIPIPGPPGSFLLSPWDMITDENLGNSSVITSQIQSSQEQLDLTDKNSSESPVSAFSNTRLSTNSNLNSMLSISDTILDQDLDLLSKSLNRVPAIPSNPVLRLMGKDLMIINQEESSRSLYIP